MMHSFIKKIIFGAVFTAAFFILGTGVSHGATKTWTAGSNSTWNTAGNWTPSGVPGSGDDVIFSSSSTFNCSIDTNANATSITIASDYAGTVTQSSGDTVTIGSGGFSQAGGTFTGSSGGDKMTVRGIFSLSGGTFKGTSGELDLPTSTFAGGVFQNNSGTVKFFDSSSTKATMTITGSSTFYNLIFGNSVDSKQMTINIGTGTVLTAQNNFSVLSWNTLFPLNGGEVDVQGNIGATHGADLNALSSPGTTAVVLTGSGSQRIGDQSICSGFPADCESVYVPTLQINKPSGSVTLSSFPQTSPANCVTCMIEIGGNWTNTSGSSISPGTSTVELWTTPTSTSVVSGSSTFYNLSFSVLSKTNKPAYFTIATGTVLTIQNNMQLEYGAFDSMVSLYGGGEVDVQGSVSSLNFPWVGNTGENIPSSTLSLVLNGTGTQTIDGTNYLFLPSVTINKSSGLVSFSGDLTHIAGDWTNLDGASIMSPGTSTVAFLSQNPAAKFTGSSTFYGFQLGMESGASFNVYMNVSTGTLITVQSSTIFSPYFNFKEYLKGGGELDAQGDLSLIYPWVPGFSSTSSFNLVMNGTGTQTINDHGNGLYDPNGGNSTALQLPSLTINKASGIVILSSAYTIIANNLTVSKGELQLSGGQDLEVDGSVNVSAGALLSDYPNVTSTIFFGSSVVNNGTIFFAGDGSGCTAPLPYNVILRSTSEGTQRSWSGSGYNFIRYADVEDQSASIANPITVWNGVSSGNNTRWTFSNGNARPELIQAVTANGGSGSPPSALTFPAYPRAGDLLIVAIASQNNAIVAPSDNAGNTYSLVSARSFGSTYSLNLYYAKNIIASSSLAVTLNGTSSAPGTYLSAGIYEYTGMAPSSTFVASSTNTSSIANTSTQITSLSAAGTSVNELFFGAAVPDIASANLSAASGWTSEFSNSCGGTCQKIFVEDFATSSILTASADWTSNATTSYAAALAIFRSIYTQGYAASGTVDSATFDTGVVSGAQVNSITWQGSATNGTAVKFQIAVSNASSGPWNSSNFIGPSGDNTTYFSGNSGTPISLKPSSGGYDLFKGRYIRYRVTLFSDPSYTYTPIVSGVSVNWSP
jgi:hypothetical protein